MPKRKKPAKNAAVEAKPMQTRARNQLVNNDSEKNNEKEDITGSVYQKRKKAANVKTVNDMTESEVQDMRKNWKFYSHAYRQRQKLAQEKLIAEILNSTSEDPLNINLNEFTDSGGKIKSIKTDQIMAKLQRIIKKQESKNDPERIKKLREKSREYYRKRRAEGKFKRVKDRSDAEKQRLREIWRKGSQNYRRRKKAAQPYNENRKRGRRKKSPIEVNKMYDSGAGQMLQETAKERKDYLNTISEGKVKMAKDMGPEEAQRTSESWQKCSGDYLQGKNQDKPSAEKSLTNESALETSNDCTYDDMSNWITEELEDSNDFFNDEPSFKVEEIVEIEPVHFPAVTALRREENVTQEILIKDYRLDEESIKTEAANDLKARGADSPQKNQKYQQTFNAFIGEVHTSGETPKTEANVIASSKMLFNLEEVYVNSENVSKTRTILPTPKDYEKLYSSLEANKLSYDSYDDISIDSADLELDSDDDISDELQLEYMFETTVEKHEQKLKPEIDVLESKTKRTYKKFKSEAERLAEVRVKRRKYYLKRKQEGRTKEAKDMSPEEIKKAREIWKQNSRAYRQRKKGLNVKLENTTSMASEDDDPFDEILNQFQKEEALKSQKEKPVNGTKKRYKRYKTEEEKRAEHLERRRKYYLKKKEEGKIKKAHEMSPAENERLRKMWKENSRAYRRRKKMQQIHNAL